MGAGQWETSHRGAGWPEDLVVWGQSFRGHFPHITVASSLWPLVYHLWKLTGGSAHRQRLFHTSLGRRVYGQDLGYHRSVFRKASCLVGSGSHAALSSSLRWLAASGQFSFLKESDGSGLQPWTCVLPLSQHPGPEQSGFSGRHPQGRWLVVSVEYFDEPQAERRVAIS